MAYTIAFFGTKPYDESSFTDKNKEFGFEIRYYKGHLNKNNVLLTQGVDAVCIFVNDIADAEVLRIMASNGVKLLALRCAGFNNVDLNAAAAAGITVVRVPAYSPYAVAEYTVALMLSLNRKIPRASWRTKDGNFSLHGLMGFDMHGKTAGIITVGEIQTMSAGTGIFHSEMNASPVEPVEFLQIWIMPRERNTRPVYQDFNISELERPNELAVIVSPDGSTPASLLQDAWFSIGKVEAGKKLGYHTHQSHAGVYIFLIEGEIIVDGEVMKRRDGMGIYDTNNFELETLKDSHILLIEVPM